MHMPNHPYVIIITPTPTTPVASVSCAPLLTNNISKQGVHHSEYDTGYEEGHGHWWNNFTQSLSPSSAYPCGF